MHTALNLKEIDLPICEVSVNDTSAKYLQKTFRATKPNFARLELHLNGQPVQFTDDVVLPFRWIWTFYDIHNFATYLKWPTDFSILSFGLLDARTLPDGHFIELDIPDSPKCRLTIGEYNSTIRIAEALGNLTQNYLLASMKGTPIDYSYWCYLAEVPNRKNTVSHKIRRYTSYPMEMIAYKCCHTASDIQNESRLLVQCNPGHIEQSIENSMLPFFMSLAAFVHFPIFLLQASNLLMSTNVKHRRTYRCVYGNTDEDEETYVYLDGNPPICLTTLLAGFCGLVDRLPIAVSRFRRTLFIVLTPCLIYVRISVYSTHMYDMVMAILNHDCSLGFLSMIGGYEKSRRVFLTAVGGPFILLSVYYFAGIFFVIIPENLDDIFDIGSNRKFRKISPLLLNVQYIEKYSLCKIANKTGYAKAAALCSAGVFLVLNPKFWYFVIKSQIRRFNVLYTIFCTHLRTVVGSVAFFLSIPFLVVVNICEIGLCAAFYGLPVITFIDIYVRGYTLCLMRLFTTHSVMTRLGKCSRLMIALFVGACFVYFVFSLSTIFTDTFVYIAKTLFFLFLSVIVYPSTSFGYLFFGVVLIFYLIKSVTGFGEVYLELLADAVDISCQLDEDPCRVQFVDDVLLVDDARTRSITKVQIENLMISLSSEQCNSMRQRNHENKRRVIYKDHIIGIPRDLFEQLIREYRPVHKQVALTCLRVLLIILLIVVTFTIISKKPLGSNEDISEVMHVVFLMAIGALPKILEVALENMNHSVRKEIQSRKIKADIVKYWRDRTTRMDD